MTAHFLAGLSDGEKYLLFSSENNYEKLYWKRNVRSFDSVNCAEKIYSFDLITHQVPVQGDISTTLLKA